MRKLRITAETLAEFKRARIRELIRKGKPVPEILRRRVYSKKESDPIIYR